MSTLTQVVSKINQLSGFSIPTGSSNYLIDPFVIPPSGSGNDTINQNNNSDMSTLAQVISQVNTLTGYTIPMGSGSYIISSSVILSSGSVNDIINQINSLTGYDIPATNVTYISGSNVAGQPTVIYLQAPASGTISTAGIFPGAIIQADHVLRIINALNGTANNDIIISGSLYVSGSATMSSSLNLPFVPNENFVESVSGSMEGTGTVNGGSF